MLGSHSEALRLHNTVLFYVKSIFKRLEENSCFVLFELQPLGFTILKQFNSPQDILRCFYCAEQYSTEARLTED